MNQKLLALYGLKWNPFSPELPTEAIYVPAKLENFCWRIGSGATPVGGSGDKSLPTGSSRRRWPLALAALSSSLIGHSTAPVRASTMSTRLKSQRAYRTCTTLKCRSRAGISKRVPPRLSVPSARRARRGTSMRKAFVSTPESGHLRATEGPDR